MDEAVKSLIFKYTELLSKAEELKDDPIIGKHQTGLASAYSKILEDLMRIVEE